MAFCRKCGNRLDAGARYCETCGTESLDAKASDLRDTVREASPAFDASTSGNSRPTAAAAPTEASASPAAPPTSSTTDNAPSKPRPTWFAIAISASVVAAVLGGGVFLSNRCEEDGCMEEARFGSYCIDHVCLADGCTMKRGYDSIYCYSHQSDLDEAESEAAGNALLDLHISDVDIDHGSSYVTAEGSVTNRGDRTYRFIRVKGSFTNRSGDVVDTDWTYACGDEGLAPGETTSFHLSAPTGSNIEDCSVRLLDYQ